MLYSKDEGWSMRTICLGEDDLVGCGIRLAVIIDPLSSLRP